MLLHFSWNLRQIQRIIHHVERHKGHVGQYTAVSDTPKAYMAIAIY